MQTRLLGALVVPLVLLAACGADADVASGGPTESAEVSIQPVEPSETEPGEPTEPMDSTEPTEPTGSPDDVAGLPPCAQVWQADAVLPRGYDGCRRGATAVPADAMSCSFGKKLVVFGDRFYAVPGGPVNQTQGALEGDQDYVVALASCTG